MKKRMVIEKHRKPIKYICVKIYNLDDKIHWICSNNGIWVYDLNTNEQGAKNGL